METDLNPPVMKRIDNPEKFLEQIKECLLYCDAKGLKTYILEHKFSNKDLYWELTSELTKHVTKETNEQTPGFFDACERCLAYFVRTGNPKEMLLALLEQADCFNDDVKYKTLIHLIQKTLLQIPRKRFHSMDISLETISAHIQLLALPEDGCLEGKERLLLAADKNIQRICDILDAFLNFVKPFAEEVSVSNRKERNGPLDSQVIVLKKHLIHVLDHPLVYLDLSYDITISKAKSKTRILAEMIMQMLVHLESDFHKFIQNSPRKESMSRVDDEDVDDEMDFQNELNEETELKKHKGDHSSNPKSRSRSKNTEKQNWKYQKSVPKLSLSCLAYLVHVERLGIEKFPSVFTHVHVLDVCLPLILSLVETTESLLVYKGIHLLRVLVELIPPQSACTDLQDNDSFTSVLTALTHIMVQCPLKELRMSAVKILPNLIQIFIPKAQHNLFKMIFGYCSNSGVRGYTVQLLKDEVSRNLLLKKPSAYFTGSQLEKVMKMAMVLPDGPATDLMEHSDSIISVLNLLRFLVLRDSPLDNVTGIWNKFDTYEAEFMEPVRVGLAMSRAHYKLELSNLQHGKDQMPPSDLDFSMTVAGQPLSAMSREQRVSVLEKALNTFDLMSSLLARLFEVKDQVTATAKSQIT